MSDDRKFWAELANKKELTKEDVLAIRNAAIEVTEWSPNESRMMVMNRVGQNEKLQKFLLADNNMAAAVAFTEALEKGINALLDQLDTKTLLDVYEGIMHPGDLKLDQLWQLRQWDGMDGTWTDIGGACTPREALLEWFRRTDSGEKNTSFQDIDYYRIFPTNTVMKWSNGEEMFRGDKGMPEPEPMMLVENKKRRPPWRFDLAAQFVSALEKGLRDVGWHVGIAGSVLHMGESKHDLDIVVFPRSTEKMDFDAARKVFEGYGMKPMYSREEVVAGWRSKGSKDDKHVEVWKWHHYRIDVFFLR